MNEDPGLGRLARDSVLWNTGLNIVVGLGQLALTVVLVRLLDPEIYGQFGLVIALIGFVLVFSGQTFFEHIVQVRPGGDLHIQDIFTAAVILNVCLFIVLNLLSLTLDKALQYTSLQIPLHLASISLLLQPARALRVAMLKRALNWRRIRTLHLVGFLVNALTAISIACAGGGIYALVASCLLIPLPYVIDLLYVERWRPTWDWDRSRFRSALHFGINRQLSAGLFACRRLLESTLIVNGMGFASFGIFGRAIGIGEMVLGRVVGQSIEAVYPALTRLDNSSSRMRRANLLTLRALVWIAVPAAAWIAMFAEPFVTMLFGQSWREVIPLVGWAMLATSLAAIAGVLYRFMLANDQTRQCLFLDLLGCVGSALLLVSTMRWGLAAYLMGLAAMHAATLSVSAAWACAGGALSLPGLASTVLAALLSTGTAWTVSAWVHGFFVHQPSIYAGMVLSTVAFCVCYLLTIRLFFCSQLRELVAYLPRQLLFRRVLLLR